MENDIPIARYIRLMGLSGTWGGQLEMSILANYYKFNVIIHQIDSEDMAQEFHPWDTKGLKILHLAYHRRRHYTSVRSNKDPGRGPATNFPIDHPLIKVREKLAAKAKKPEENKKQ